MSVPLTVAELARALQADAWGDLDAPITGAAEPGDAAESQIALAMSQRYAEALRPGSIAMLAPGMDPAAFGLRAAIFAPRPRLALAGLTQAFDPGPGIAPGIHPTAVIDPTAEIGADAAIAPLAVIGAGARIGPRARIGAHVSIGPGALIGADALIMDGARIGGGVRAGDRLIVQMGAVIGGDGFAYVTELPSGVEQSRSTLGERDSFPDQPWHRIHSLGWVELGDDVELGANSAIDRGTIRATRVGSGTKIDNHVQVGHNVEIGRDCLISGQVGLAGSCRIGDRTVLGGQCGVSDNISVGSDVVAGGATKIYTNVPNGRVILGNPALRMTAELEQRRLLRRLPRLFARVTRLEGAGPTEAEKS